MGSAASSTRSERTKNSQRGGVPPVDITSNRGPSSSAKRPKLDDSIAVVNLEASGRPRAASASAATAPPAKQRPASQPLPEAAQKEVPEKKDSQKSFVAIFGRRELPAEFLEKYGIGMYEIDAQHNKLFDMIYALDRLKDHNYEGAEQVIGGLVDYTRYHFDMEEGLMTRVEYPEFPGHRQMHKVFVDKVLKAVFHFDFGDTKAIGEFGEFLFDWLVTHIANTDKKFSNWLEAPEQAEKKQRLLNDGLIVVKKK
eukprot:m51a1_g5580 hypothetical protein (254) ;mRNA; f:627582-628587